jgi:hypothetical protein
MATHDQLTAQRHLSSSILLWMRTDRPRQAGMDHWKGPHSGIISATPGLEEYRQIHLADHNPGRWPSVDGIDTSIPLDRKVDGVAEVTFRSALSPLLGRTQTQLAFRDEVNVFRRTLLYAGTPKSARWYDVDDGSEVGARALVLLRRRRGVGGQVFRRFVTQQLVPAVAAAAALTELRSQTFLPWAEKTWDTPNVAHDNPKDQRFHASLILGFATSDDRDEFYAGPAGQRLSALIAPSTSAIHAYDVAETLTFVEHGQVLPTPSS